MNLYLDTSALVKLYIAEKDSDRVQRLSDQAARRWISILGYVEARSGFARRLREKHLAGEAHDELVRNLNEDWQHLDVVMLEPDLAWRAGALARRHALRGAELGRFEMGSTVILLFEPGRITWHLEPGAVVRLGQVIATAG